MRDAPPLPKDLTLEYAPARAVRHTIGSRLAARQNNFDFIRLAAAFLVIFSHSWPLHDPKGASYNEPYSRLSGYCSFGEVAVAIFFVISGLLVARSYLSDPHPFAFLRK